MKKVLLYSFFILSTVNCVLFSQQMRKPQNAQDVLSKASRNFFIENKGQWDPQVKYLAKVGGMNAWITKTGVVYDYFQFVKNENLSSAPTKMLGPIEEKEEELKNRSIKGHVVKTQLLEANQNASYLGSNKQEGYFNYFFGNDRSKHASFIPLYGEVSISGAYNNIDVKYYFEGNTIRYDYKIKPGADVTKLKLKFEGTDGIVVNPNGELVLKTSLGNVTNGKLYSYQIENGNQKEVVCKFEQNPDGTVGFKAEYYDRNKELIIDPLIYSTFLGGSSFDQGYSIAVDAGGNAYVAGYTLSTNFPLTAGAYQTTSEGYSAFVSKLNSTGSGLVYSTYLGGNSSEIIYSIAIDASGNAYVSGTTHSTNFPVTAGAYQITFGGGTYSDGFVSKLNSTGSGLVYSTYLGGSNDDWGNSIAIDVSGNTYITGLTISTNFPVTAGAYQTTFGGSTYGDAFVTRLNSSGSGLVYSTYLGGSKLDYGNSVAVDASGNAYVTGATESTNFPVTAGAYQTTYGGVLYHDDSFVTKLNSTGSGLVYSTYLCGSEYDYGTAIAIDASGNAYVTGKTESTNFPVTTGAFQTTGGGLYSDAFVTKLNSTGSGLVYSTYLGGNLIDGGSSIAIDVFGNAYVTGVTKSINFPITAGAYQTTYGGSTFGDAFVTKLNSTGSGLTYSTYLGGNSADNGCSITIDASANVYVTGYTESINFSVTAGAYQTSIGGVSSADAFITKLGLQITFVEGAAMPTVVSLSQNYPNPFNPETAIQYSL